MLKNKKLLVAMILAVVPAVVLEVANYVLVGIDGALSGYPYVVLRYVLPCAVLLLSINGQRKKAIVCVGVALALNAAGLLYELLMFGRMWLQYSVVIFNFIDVVSEIALLVFLCLKKKNRWVWIGVGVVLTVLLSSDVLMYIKLMFTSSISYMRYIIYYMPKMSLGFVYLFGFMDPHHEFSCPQPVVVTSAQAAYKWVREVAKDPTKVTAFFHKMTAFFRKVTNVMFTNIGGKIKTLTGVVCWIGIVASVLLGVAGLFNGEVLAGLAMIVGGVLASWVGSFILYAFGELVENVAVIAEMQVKADAEKHQHSEEN